MPMRWVPPALFLEYKGKQVYCAYNDDNENYPYDYIYTTDEAEEEHYEFDVRSLRHEKKLLQDVELDLSKYEDQQRVIRAAIDADALEFPEDDDA